MSADIISPLHKMNKMSLRQLCLACLISAITNVLIAILTLEAGKGCGQVGVTYILIA